VLGDVGAPEPVRAIGDEPASDEVLVRRGQRAGPGEFAVVADPGRAGGRHQPGDPFAPAGHPGAQAEVGVDPWRAVGAPGPGVDVPDLDEQLLIALVPGRGRPLPQVVVGRTRQLEHPGRTPRRGTRRRPAHGPAGPSFWEHVLPGEERRGPLEDLDLHLQDPVAAAQLDQLRPLVPGRAIGPAGLHVIGLHPAAQTRLGDPEITRDLRDRVLPGTGKLDRIPAELRRLGSRHQQAPLQDDHRLRPGVRRTGSSSRRQGDPSVPPAPGWVHCTYCWVVEDDTYLGAVALRHELNDFLFEAAGHIGYSIRPSARRRGLATWALARTLERARTMGLDRVLVTCDPGNTASARTIERSGGQLEDTRDTSDGPRRRYWITL